MTDDDRDVLYVHADYNPDEVRCFYEVPEAAVERIRPAGDRRTFVQALTDLVGCHPTNANGGAT